MSAPLVSRAHPPDVEERVSRSHLDGARLRTARALFAESLDGPTDSATLGSITLRADQLRTLRRVRSHLARDGGCVLANDVGTGKTYVALASARAWRAPLVVVPASLRATWRDAIERAALQCAVVSHEALSRGVVVAESFDGIIVDESHRFRPTSRRYAMLARLSARAPVLLLSATPLQNRTRELAAQVALFAGDAAHQLAPSELARYVVRGVPLAHGFLPRVAPPRWLGVRADDGDVLRAILALPPPPRATDAGDGGALLAISLVRAWASSRAALLATVRRRRHTLAAMQQCFEEGRVPSRAELRTWRGGGEVQLGFAALLAASAIERRSAESLAVALASERRALDALLATLDRTEDPDVARVHALRSVRAAHPSASILAFSESAATVRAYFDALRRDAGIGMLTAREGRIASGRIPREELLARFAPVAQRARVPVAHERVSLLVSTDLLSEGVNLQDASVVVHLDLPWNPARLAQRLGRVRRPGGAAIVFGYLMSPPAESSLLLRAEARLRDKLARAERTVGHGLDVLPVLVSPGTAGTAGAATPAWGASKLAAELGDVDGSERQLSDAEYRGEIDARLASWRGQPGRRSVARRNRCVVAGVRAEATGWVAVLSDGRIVASIRWGAGESAPRSDPEAEAMVAQPKATQSSRAMQSTPMPEAPVRAAEPDPRDPPAFDDARTIARALELADGPPRIASPAERRTALVELSRLLESEWVLRSCGLMVGSHRLRRAMHRRIAAIVAAAPRHQRTAVIALATRLRLRLDAGLPLGAERALVEHAATEVNVSGVRADESSSQAGRAWLDRALELTSGAPRHAPGVDPLERPLPRAVILLAP